MSDEANLSLIPQFRKSNKTLIHTSGSIEMSIFEGISDNYGVLYPLQTFNKNIQLNLSQVPFIIEAGNSQTLKLLHDITASTGARFYEATSLQRMQMHIAAIFTNNFTNHMFSVSEKIMAKNNLPIDLLYPLMNQTIAKAKQGSPVKMQTGPAVRNDVRITKKHLDLLKTDFKEFENLYKTISDSIFEMHKLNVETTHDPLREPEF